MHKDKIYVLIAVVLLVGVYGYNFYLEQGELITFVEKGIKVNGETNLFFLPSSTTGQIVHHEGYSLSYNEKYNRQNGWHTN